MKEEKQKTSHMEVELNICGKFFEFMGLQYFSLKELNAQNVNKRPTIFRTFHLVILILILCTTLVLSIEENSTSHGKVTAKNVIMLAVKSSLNIGLTSVMCISLVQSFMSTKKNKKIFLNLKKISEITHQEFGVEVNFKSLKAKSLRRLCFIYVGFAALHGSVTLFYIFNEKILVKMFIAIYPFAFLLATNFKITFYVELINFSLELLKKLIMDIFQHKPIGIIENIDFHLKRVKSKNDPLEQLRAIRKIFNLINECGGLQNKSHGFMLLIMLCTLVISLTVSGYDLFVALFTKVAFDRFPGKLTTRLFINLTLLLSNYVCNIL